MHPNTHLTPDAEGCYTVVLSNFGRDAVQGPKEPLSQDLIEDLWSRVQRGQLRGEFGHPSKETDGRPVTNDRMFDIREDRVAVAYRDIEVESVEDPNSLGGRFQRVKAKIALVGPYGETVKQQIENEPEKPLYFGLRAFVIWDYDATLKLEKAEITQVITWDLVQEDPYTHGLK